MIAQLIRDGEQLVVQQLDQGPKLIRVPLVRRR